MHIPLNDIKAIPLFQRQIERVQVSDVQIARTISPKKHGVEGQPFIEAKKVSPACHRANQSVMGRNEKIAALFVGLSGLAAAAVTTSLIALVILGLTGTVYLTCKVYQKTKGSQNKEPYATIRDSYAHADIKTSFLSNPQDKAPDTFPRVDDRLKPKVKPIALSDPEDKAPDTFPRVGDRLKPKMKTIALSSPEDKAPNLPPRIGDRLAPKKKKKLSTSYKSETTAGKEIEVIGRQIEKLWQSGRMHDLYESVEAFEVPTNHDLSDTEWSFNDDLDQSQIQDMMELY